MFAKKIPVKAITKTPKWPSIGTTDSTKKSYKRNVPCLAIYKLNTNRYRSSEDSRSQMGQCSAKGEVQWSHCAKETEGYKKLLKLWTIVMQSSVKMWYIVKQSYIDQYL